MMTMMAENQETPQMKSSKVKAYDINPVSRNITTLQQMISSCSGAIITSIFVTPLDVVKIRLQAQKSPMQKGQCFLYCNGLMDHTCVCINGNGTNSVRWYKRQPPKPFTGTLDAFRYIGRNEGIRSLWSGLPPTLVMAVPATVIYFSSYEWWRAYLNSVSALSGSEFLKPMTAGAVARIWAVTVISPLEMIRTKMQSEQMTYKHVFLALQETVKRDGALSLWKGLVPTLLRDVPFSALYWLNYENLKMKVLKLRGSDQLTFIESFSAGGVSGAIAGFITLPFDVIKTHRQIELGQAIAVSQNKTKVSSSTFVLIRNLCQQQGVKALFAGLVPRMVKVAPACAIMISTYEYFKAFFRDYNRIHE